MACRLLAALLLALVLGAIGAGDAIAAGGTTGAGGPIAGIAPLSSTPLTRLGGPPPGLRRPSHRHLRPAPPPRPRPVPTRTASGTLPMTGAEAPLELGIAAGLLATGILARALTRRRRYRYRRF